MNTHLLGRESFGRKRTLTAVFIVSLFVFLGAFVVSSANADQRTVSGTSGNNLWINQGTANKNTFLRNHIKVQVQSVGNGGGGMSVRMRTSPSLTAMTSFANIGGHKSSSSTWHFAVNNSQPIPYAHPTMTFYTAINLSGSCGANPCAAGAWKFVLQYNLQIPYI